MLDFAGDDPTMLGIASGVAGCVMGMVGTVLIALDAQRQWWWSSMRLMVIVGTIIAVVGTILVVANLESEQQEVAAREEMAPGVLNQTLGPFHLDGGTYTIWMEEGPSWPEGPYVTRVQLVDDEGEEVEVRTTHYQTTTIRSRRYVQMATTYEMSSGDYWLDLQVRDPEGSSPPSGVEVLVLTIPEERDTAALVLGLVLAVLGLGVAALSANGTFENVLDGRR